MQFTQLILLVWKENVHEDLQLKMNTRICPRIRTTIAMTIYRAVTRCKVLPEKSYLSKTTLWCLKVTQLCPTLCNPMDYTIHGILQARILGWVAFPFSRGSSQPRDQTQVSHIAGEFFNQLSHQGSPRILEWVAYPFSRGSSQPRNWNRVSCIAGGWCIWSIQLTNWIISFSAFSMWPSIPPPTGNRVYIFLPIGSRFGQVTCFSQWNATKHDDDAMKDFQWVCVICVRHFSYLLQWENMPGCQHQGEKCTRIRTQLV